MRMLRLVAAFLAVLLAPQVWPPVWAAPSSTFSLSSPTVQAGAPEVFTITRLSGGNGVYVLFQTFDLTALAGTDYTATKKLIYFKGGTVTATVSVPTAVNAMATKLTFRASIAASTVAVSATGTIIEPTQTCSDGSVVPLTQSCPTPPPPTTNTWVAAPLQDGNFARVKVNDNLWDITGPGAGRQLQVGEIVAVYFNGWGSEFNGKTSFAIYALADGTSGHVYAADLEGVAPVGTPPSLPANWWVPGLVIANKTCTDPRAGHEGQPGVTQGGVYRAAMLIGTHSKLASGVTGYAGAMWQVFATGDQNAPTSAAFTIVNGDCLTGQ